MCGGDNGCKKFKRMVMKRSRKKQATMKIIQILIGLQVEVKEDGYSGQTNDK